MLWLVLLIAGLWVIQGLLGFWQFRHFNQRFRLLRNEGRVVVGKSKVRIMAGVVVMFCLDQDCNIIKGEKMAGISIFARLRPFNYLNNINLLEITKKQYNGLDRPTYKAVRNAVENYQAFINKTKADIEVIGRENERISV